MQEQHYRSTNRRTLEEIFTVVFVIVDDALKEIEPKEIAERRNIKEAKLSDSEVITISLVGEMMGIDSENAWLGYVEKNFAYLFPQIVERSRFNRRRKDLGAIVNLLRKRLLDIIGRHPDDLYLIDSLPIPVCHYKRSSRAEVFAGLADFGVCEAKEEKVYGFKLHTLITSKGLVVDFTLAPASHHDVTLAPELLEHYQNIMVLADKGYVSQELGEELKTNNVALLTMQRKNQATYNGKMNKTIGRVRRLVETVFSQLTNQFNISKVLAKSLFGLRARLYTKLAAHTMAFYLNKLFGLPALNIKGLVFN